MRTTRAAALRAATEAVQTVDPWLAAVRAAVADPTQPQLAAQPVVDLTRGGIAGYELLLRFPGPPDAPAHRWLAEAERAGLGAHLQARILERALELRPTLPDAAFLVVNLSPAALPAEPVQAVLERAGRLDALVIDLTEPAVPGDEDVLAALSKLSAAGALVAVHDAGAGLAAMRQIAEVRPALVRVGRDLVADLDSDPDKAALVGLLARVARSHGAWLSASGVETPGELEAVSRLGIPLAQGHLLAAPGPLWAGLQDGAARLVRETSERVSGSHWVSGQLEDAESVPVGCGDVPHSGAILVEVDALGRPVAVVHAARGEPRRTASTGLATVLPTDTVEHALTVAMARGSVHRFDPLVCTDVSGRLLGVARVERLVSALATRTG